MHKIIVIKLFLFLLLPNFLFAQSTEIKYLSGTGAEHTVDWEFYCSDGMNSGKWTMKSALRIKS